MAADRPAPIIRPLATADRPLLIGALRSDGTFLDEEIEVAVELIDANLEHGDKDYIVRVADAAGRRACGYVCFGRTPMTESTWDLYWIVTHAEARGLGLASRLIAAMEEEIGRDGGGAIRVETSQKDSHDAARRLYARLGYPEVARFADFYRAGDDLIVYYKRL